MRSKAYLVVSFVALCCAGCVTSYAQTTAVGQFAYSGDEGPGFWSKFDSRCAAASTRQSPINIDQVTGDPRLGPLDLFLLETNVALVNPGYTLQGNVPEGGFLTLDNDRYTILQFHFHTLSEHTIAGRRGLMELHIVFENERHQYAVVGQIFRLGRSNPFLQRLIDAGLPETTHAEPVEVKHLEIRSVLKDTSAYYKYAGSLTTPPCSQNVTWLVLKRWAELSPKQFDAFRRIVGNDFRPLQKRYDRDIHATVGRQEDDETETHATDE